MTWATLAASVMRNALRGVVVVAAALPALYARAESNLPDEWVADYDYKETLTAYLKRQYDSAVGRKLVPYVYLYADWCPPCVHLRARVRKQPDYARVKTLAGGQLWRSIDPQ